MAEIQSHHQVVGGSKSSEFEGPASAAATAATGTATTTTTTTTTTTKQWRCDVCLNRWFDDFQDAVEHENTCQQEFDSVAAAAAATATTASSSAPASSAVTAVAAAPLVVTQEYLDTTTKKDEPASSSSSSSSSSPASSRASSPIITPTRTPQRDKNSSRAAAGNNSNAISSVVSVRKVVEEIKHSILLISEQQKTFSSAIAMAIDDANEVHSITEMFEQLDSLDITFDILSNTLIGTIVSKFKKHPILGVKAKELIIKWKKISTTETAATTTKKKKGVVVVTKKQKKAVVVTKQKKAAVVTKKKKATVKPHSFFAPRKQSAIEKENLSSSSSSCQPSMNNSFFAPKLSSQKQQEEETKTIIEESNCTKPVAMKTKEKAAIATTTKATTTTPPKILKRKQPSSSMPTSTSSAKTIGLKDAAAINVDNDNDNDNDNDDDEMIDDPIDVDIDVVADEKESTKEGAVAIVVAGTTTNNRRSTRIRTPTRSASTEDTVPTKKKAKSKSKTVTVQSTASKKKAKKKVVASIFQNKTSKQLLAEQRSVELAAKQELSRRKEQERQAKRAALFQNKKGNSTSSSSGDHHDRQHLSVNNNNKNLPPSAPKFPVPNHIMNDGVEEKYITSSSAAAATTTTDTVCLLPPNHPFRSSKSKSTITTITSNNSVASTCRTWYLSSPSSLDIMHDHTAVYTTIQRAMLETFLIPTVVGSGVAAGLAGRKSSSKALSSSLSASSDSSDTRLWNDKYGMEQNGIVGKNANKIFHQLVECIDQWRMSRKESLERMAERHRKLQAKHRRAVARGDGRYSIDGKKAKRKGKKKGNKTTTTTITKKKKRKYEYHDDDDWLVDEEYDENKNQISNLYLLTGPPSCGKTSMVHYVAKHCGNCKVLEINTSQIRSGAALKNAIEEATQSYSSSFTTIQQKEKQTNNKDATNLLFNATSNKKSRTIVDSDSGDSDSDDNNTSSSTDSSDDDDHDDEKDNEKNDTNKSSVTVVLIDEVDILFDVEGDAGFWAALGSLAKSTKCPIILTANHCPSQLHNNNSLSCQRFQLERPTPIECSSKLLQICRTENLQFRPDLLLLPDEDTIGEGEKDGSHNDSDNDNDAIRIQKQLSTIATSCHCDLRKMIQELQVFSCSATAIAIAIAAASATATATATASAKVSSGNLRLASSALASARVVASSTRTNDSSDDDDGDDDWRPMIHSLEPSSIPMDKFSIITVKGKNFDSFRSVVSSNMVDDDDDDIKEITVQIGRSNSSNSTPHSSCRKHIIDDETMIMLCPPYSLQEEEKECATFCSRLLKRILPVSIECPLLGLCGSSPSRIVKSEELIDGNHVIGTHWLTVEYVFPPEDGQHHTAVVDDVVPGTCDEEKTKDNNSMNEDDGDGDGDGDDDDDDDDEVEFELDGKKKQHNDTNNDNSIDEAEKQPTYNKTCDAIEGYEGGLALWKNALCISKLTTVGDVPNTSHVNDTTASNSTTGKQQQQQKKKITTQSDLDIAAQLDLLSKNAHNASDASFLEDFNDGLPYLSGACKGFGFDYTEDCIGSNPTTSGGGGTDNAQLRMHEKSRPPGEEKLFDLGWNENCYFHGNADTYMTVPSLSQRKEMNIFMNHHRGDETSAGQLAIVTTNTAVGSCSGSGAVSSSSPFYEDIHIDSREDFDWYANQESSRAVSSEEDCLLPQYVPPAIKNLPNLLRGGDCAMMMDHKIHDDIERRKEECCTRLATQVTEYILPTTIWNTKSNVAKWWSYGKFGFANNERDCIHLVLELMPFLRRISILENAAEFAELKAKEENNDENDTNSTGRPRRSSRQTVAHPRGWQAKAARRHHYFDKLSVTLRRDEADLNSIEVGNLFVIDRIVYNK